MLRPNLKKGCKTWDKGKGFWKSFLILLLMLSNDTPRPFLYDKNIVIRFGDRL
jgi:hypothetical protein